MRSRYHIFLMSVFLIGTVINELKAQIFRGGEPTSWEVKDVNRFSIEFISLADLNMELIAAQDAISDLEKDTPYRFGIEQDVNYTLDNSGVWEELENGGRVWRLGVESNMATSFSFHFNEFKLEKGAELFVWNADRTSFIGSFTHLNNKESGVFPVSLVNGNKVVLEYHLPAGVEAGDFSISQIIEGYRPLVNKFEIENRGPYGDSGACNINVNCPEGSNWQNEKQAVALIISGGFAECTGALVNNTANDGTPYFLTANHCVGNPSNWVYVFNHESDNCNGDTGPTTQTVSSGTLRASNSGSDFALIELSEIPPADYNIQYLGWDRSDAETVTEAVGIHHPSGDIKKICFEEDAPYHATQQGTEVWYIDEWEAGVTEGGSSGSPLFDQNRRVIGQLYGGGAACNGSTNNGQPDWYGRFGVSWDGNSADSRLRDWLDPQGTNATIINTFPTAYQPYENDGGIFFAEEPEAVLCSNSFIPVITLFNNGTQEISGVDFNYSVGMNSNEYAWEGTLNPGESINIQLSNLYLSNGENTFSIEVVMAEDENDANNAFNYVFNAVTETTEDFELNLELDNYGNETTWEILNSDNGVFYEGGPYSDPEGTIISEEFCIPEGCYEFVIYDSAGDGICCGSFGDGSYSLLNSLGNSVAEGGEFDDSETSAFCADNVSVDELSNAILAIFPNPVKNTLHVTFEDQATELLVHDVSGKMVFRKVILQSGQTDINLGNLQNGTYILSAQSNGYLKRSVFVKE